MDKSSHCYFQVFSETQRTCLGHDAGVEGSRPDHILMSDKVPAVNLEGADWGMQAEHVCKLGGCGSRLSLKWRPELVEVYADALVRNIEMQAQFEQAIKKEDPVSARETACFCLRSMIVQAAGDAGMAGLVSVCGPLGASWRGTHSPPWFDAACREKLCVFMEALQTGQPLHAPYTRRQKDVFLGRLYNKDPDVLHAVLPALETYLSAHFRPREAAQL
eukprot:1141949-Pelagomonas_calceolata.AAC.1